MNIFKPTLTAPLLVALGLSLALIAAPASAAKGGGGNGPTENNRQGASVSATTVCEIIDENLVATVRLTDKTSGVGAASITSASVVGVKKIKPGSWDNPYNVALIMPAVSHTYTPAAEVAVDGEAWELEALKIDLCDEDLSGVKALNVDAVITYRQATDEFNLNDRYIENRCSGVTDYNDDGSVLAEYTAGIKLTPAIRIAVAAACAAD